MLGSGSPIEWGIFAAIVVGMLVLDLAVFNRKAHEISLRESAIWSVVWILISLGFNGYVWYLHGNEAAANFFTAYVVEKSLSVDNLFVFLAIFNYFRVPSEYQHRVLFWGVMGALVMRALFIGLGAALLMSFDWMMYLFGAFLIYTGFKLGFSKGETVDPANSLVLKLASKYLRFTKELHQTHFFVRRDGVWLATPLFLVLLIIEFTDVVFAVDSVPAVLGISKDLFIVYSSNIFAILGLRALFFLLAGVMVKLRYLNFGLAVVLTFIGAKMIVEKWLHVPTWVSLGVISFILVGTTLASLLIKPKAEPTRT